MKKKLFCVCCRTPLENLDEKGGMHPMNGLEFRSYGHYGSAVFDPMNGSSIHIVVCDSCLKKYDDEGHTLRVPFEYAYLY